MYTVKLINDGIEIDISCIVSADSVSIKKQLHKNGKPVIDEAKLTLYPEIANDDEDAIDTQYIIDKIKKHTSIAIARDNKLIFTGRLKFDPKVNLYP